MSYTIELIEKYKRLKKIESDYAVAKSLGLTQQAVSNYRMGLSHADDRVAVIIADELGLDRFRTIARIQSERAKKAEERAFWKRLATAAAVLIAMGVTSAPTNAANATNEFLHKSSVVDITHRSAL